MFKKELFKDIQWDNDLKLAEHSDFYLRLKNDTKWKVAFVDKVLAEHQTTPNNAIYIKFRRIINNNLGIDIFYKKYNIKSEKDIIFLKDKER
jgi:hypothetical protein